MTKTNLTLLTIGLVAASLLASCKKNDNGGTADGQGFKASIEQSSDSRTHGEVGVNDNVVNVKWTAYDQILLANNADNAGASTTLTYELTEGENTSDGTFYTGQPHDDFFHPNYAAIYPNVNSEGTANSISGKNATFNLPATQAYSGSNVFAEKVVPMVAYSTSQTLQFKNACGGLRFPMVGSGITVQRVELTTNSFNTNQHLSGKFEVDCSASDPILDWKSDGGNTITIDCGSGGITLDNTTTYFYFMLPPGTLHGLSLTAYDNNNQEVYHAENETDYEIVRNKIKKVGANLEIPLEVTTASPTYITTTSAKGGVSVANGTATETGICWGTSNTPDINGSHATGTTAIDMINLTPNTVYYVRAYAISANGTCYYGEAIPFASRANFTNGKLPGAFHTAANEVCYFSMGNLQCKAKYDLNENWETNWTNGNVVYRYAENQFDYVGGGSPGSQGTVYNPDGSLSKNNEKSAHNNKWFDVFAWGTSGYRHNSGSWTYNSTNYNYQYYPWIKYGSEISYIDNAHENQSLWAYRNKDYDLNSSTKQADWGYNKIQNGLNAEGIDNKFTPSNAQMRYLLHTRTAPTLNGVANARFAFTKLIVKNDKEVRGLMLFPDSYTWPSQVAQPKYINQIGQGANPYFGDGTAGQWDRIDFSIYTEAEWTMLEKAGMVFLPCGGCWGSTQAADEWTNRGGRYWTSSHSGDYGAHEFAFSPDNLGTGFNVTTGNQQRKFGFCVRLLIK